MHERTDPTLINPALAGLQESVIFRLYLKEAKDPMEMTSTLLYQWEVAEKKQDLNELLLLSECTNYFLELYGSQEYCLPLKNKQENHENDFIAAVGEYINQGGQDRSFAQIVKAANINPFVIRFLDQSKIPELEVQLNSADETKVQETLASEVFSEFCGNEDMFVGCECDLGDPRVSEDEAKEELENIMQQLYLRLMITGCFPSKDESKFYLHAAFQKVLVAAKKRFEKDEFLKICNIPKFIRENKLKPVDFLYGN